MNAPRLSVKSARAYFWRSALSACLTGTFTFGSDSETKAELDEITRQSLALW